MKIVSLLVLVMWIALPVPARAQDDAGWLLGQINALRASKGLHPFTTNGALTASAQGHSVYLANNPWTDPHVESNGSTPRSRMAAAGYSGTYVGENVYGGSMATASIAFNWWLGSPVHYSGLVHQSYTEIGIGVARGSYGAFYTLNFGGGAGAAPPQPVVPPSQQGGGQTAPVARQATRAPTRRPLPTAIPTNTPGPSLTPSQTFTPIPSKPPTETPVVAPTETPIIFELNVTDIPVAEKIAPTEKVAPTVTPTTQKTAVKVAALSTGMSYPTEMYTLSPTPFPTMIPVSQAAPLKLDGAAIGATNTAGGSDPVRSLIPIAIAIQAIILGAVVLRRGKH